MLWKWLPESTKKHARVTGSGEFHHDDQRLACGSGGPPLDYSLTGHGGNLVAQLRLFGHGRPQLNPLTWSLIGSTPHNLGLSGVRQASKTTPKRISSLSLVPEAN